MEGRRSEVRDRRDAESVKPMPAPLPYRAPRLTVTGKAVAVIRGARPAGWADTNAPNFYPWGE